MVMSSSPCIHAAIAAFCFIQASLFQVAVASQCKYIDFTSDNCRSSSYIRIASQTVFKGSKDVRIKLPDNQQTEATWFCGDSKERVAWGTAANQIRVNFLDSGAVQWTIYLCDDLSGPVKAGVKCSDEAYSTACPGDPNSNVTCVFEVSTSSTFIEKTSTSVQLTASISKDIKGLATAEVSGSITRERSSATIVEYKQKSYLIIPAGFRFCSFSDAVTIKDVLTPTGYKWQCSLTKFLQLKLSYTGACSSLPKCEKRVCVAENNPAPGSAPAKSAFSLLSTFAISASLTVISSML